MKTKSMVPAFALAAGMALLTMQTGCVTVQKTGAIQSDYSRYAGISPDTSKPFYAMSDDMAGPTLWQDAKLACESLNIPEDHSKGWRLPTKNELNVMFRNQAAIGNFTQGPRADSWYWSSTQFLAAVWQQHFQDGFTNLAYVADDSSARAQYPISVRCVRN